MVTGFRLVQQALTIFKPILILNYYYYYYYYYCGPGLCSQYSDSLRAGRSLDRILMRARFFAPVHTCPAVHPASCLMSRVCGVNHRCHLASRSKKELNYTSNPLLCLQDMLHGEFIVVFVVEYRDSSFSVVTKLQNVCPIYRGLIRGVPEMFPFTASTHFLFFCQLCIKFRPSFFQLVFALLPLLMLE